MVGSREKLLGVRLAPEWIGQYPVRVSTPEDDVPLDVSPEELVDEYGVPADICAAIEEWDREFQDTYRPDDPAQSGFEDEETMERWVERGLAIGRRLAGELGPRIPVEIRTARGRVIVDADPTTAPDHPGG